MTVDVAPSRIAEARRGCADIATEISIEDVDCTEPWRGGVSALNLLLRAPMAHVGCSDLDVFVELFVGEEKVRGLPQGGRPKTAFAPVWFDQVDEGLCVFGADEVATATVVEALFGAALATAEVYCHQHGLLPPKTLDDACALGIALGLAPLLGPLSPATAAARRDLFSSV